MKLLITGATGYIGQRLSVLAAANGYEVICATRQPCSATYIWLAYDLLGTPPECPAGVQVIIHLAADTSTGTHTNLDYEVTAAKALINRAQQACARFIFISSQTAGAMATSDYGRTKWRIEQEVLAAGGVVVRPGQVYGGPERGLFGLLTGLVRRIPLIPQFIPAPSVQPIHVDDLAASILTIVEREDIGSEIFKLGAIQSISFKGFLLSIATHRVRAVRLPVPVPVVLLKLIAAVLGRSLSTKLGLQRILSLINLPRMDSEESLKKLGLKLRPLAYGMHRSGRGQRRQRLQEGAILLGYLLKSPPRISLVIRYARALESAGDTSALISSNFLSRWPILMALLDNQSVFKEPRGRKLSWRLQVALGIAEASPQGAQAFLGTLQQRHPAVILVALGFASTKEFVWRVSALIFRPLARQLFLGSGAKREA
ncbi:NAD-dependent epimerase/dehydratase family protein [Pseudomonas protegens]|uniref:NAD-dependent epimerase/dehydratase family protein n=1 Tax=Pseudomonas protegens TaxID=380021 RepID=UPI0032EDEDAC